MCGRAGQVMKYHRRREISAGKRERQTKKEMQVERAQDRRVTEKAQGIWWGRRCDGGRGYVWGHVFS